MPRQKNRLPRLVAGAFVLSSFLYAAGDALAQPRAPLDRPAPSRSSHQGAAAWWHRQRAYPAGHIPARAYEEAFARWQALRPAHMPRAKALWHLVGPAGLDTASGANAPNPNWTEVAGRITAIGVDPSNTKILYAGAALGGVWKSIDGGAAWKPLTDAQPSLAVGSIAVDPTAPQTVWVGTGDGDPYSDSAGQGLLRSTDGGATWTRPAGAKFAGVSISRIVLDTKAGDVYVGVDFGGVGAGDTCTNTDATAAGQGLHRSSDGGKTWTLLLAGSIIDVEVDTTVSPRRVYAYDYGNGVHRSVDGGGSWLGTTGLPAKEDRYELAIAPSMPSVVYAGGGVKGQGVLYVSTDFGATFAPVPGAPDYCTAQCYFDDAVAVAPDDPGTVYLGGASCSVWKVTGALGASPVSSAVSLPNGDCGAMNMNWPSGYVHSDAHVMAFDPSAPQTLYVGTDGGLARTKDGGGTWERLNTGVSTIELYAVCADPTHADVLFGGAQDNGPMMRTSSSLVWQGIATGDGTGCAIDPVDPKRVLVSIQYGTTFLSVDHFQQDFHVVFDTQQPNCQGLAGCGDRASFVPPLLAHPSKKGTFYLGTYRLWRSTKGGIDGSWKAISGDLTAGLHSAPCVPAGSGMEDDYLSAIGPSASDPAHIYAGSASGKLQVTVDDGKTWQSLGDGVLPQRYLTGIAVDPLDPKTVAVSYSGFAASTPGTPGHVFRSTDGGQTWKHGDLGMDLPVNQILAHPTLPGVLYAGMDLGVLASSDGGATWVPLGVGLPNAPVLSLSYRAGTTSLVAGTHGRSAWEIAFTPSLVVSPATLSFPVTLGHAPATEVLTVANGDAFGSVLPVTVAAGAPWLSVTPTSGQAGGAAAVTVTVSVDVTGKGVGTYDSAVTVTATGPGAGSITVPVHVVVKKAAPPVTMMAAGGCGCMIRTAADEKATLGALAALALGAQARRRRRAPIARRGVASGFRA